MEPITQIYPLLQIAFLGFALLTGGPPLVVGQSAALIAATAPKAPAEQPAANAPAPQAPAIAAAPAPAPAPAAPPAAHGAATVPAPAGPAAAAPVPPPVAQAPVKNLKGLAAWSALVGNTAKGESDGEQLYEFYAKNGTVKQLVGNDKATGKWVLKGETVCFDYDNGDGETCYSVSVSDGQVTFTDEDANNLTYEILPGNAKKL